jgi:hypothetical protein
VRLRGTLPFFKMLLGLLLGVYSGTASADSIKGYLLDIELVPEDNALEITESYLFDADAEDILSHRTIYLAPVPGWPLIKQDVYDIEVHELDDQADQRGRELDFEVYELPNDRIQIDFELPEDWNQTLTIAWVVSGVTKFGGDAERIELSTWPNAWDLPYEETMLVFHLPEEDMVEDTVLKTELIAFDEELDSESYWVEGRYVEFWPKVEEPIVLELVLELPEGTMDPGEDDAWLQAIIEAGGLPLMALLIMLPLAPVLRILPPRLSIGAAAVWNVVLGLAFCSILGPDLAFFVLAEGGVDSHEWMLNAMSTFVADLLLMGAAMVLLLVQSNNLLRGHPGAWTTQLAVPMGFSVMLFFAGVVPGFLFVFLGAWLMLLFWTRRRLAMHMGADLGPVIQHVLTEGEIQLSALASHFGMARHRLSRLLRDRPELPIATDHDRDMVYSAATLATHSELSCCSNCGGATTIQGMEKVVCPYCEQIQASEQESEQLPPPVPLLVQTIADLLRFLGQSVLSMGVFLMCLFGFFALGEEDWMEGMILAAFVAAVGIIGGLSLMNMDESLRSGKSDSNVRILLWIGSPLILPLFALRDFGKPRIRLHFGETKLLAPLKAKLETNQQISLVEIGEILQAPYQESAELARYLAATGQLDAIYDRQATRLVSRAAYRGLARQGSCLSCGGLLRVGPSGLACQHCGEAAT